MQLIYSQNPLTCAAHLNPMDHQMLRYALINEELMDTLYDAHYTLNQEPKDPQILDKIKTILEPEYYSETFDTQITERVALFANELTLGYSHAGDCTAIPASCCKCWAEQYLGMANYLKGMNKHMGHTFFNFFNQQRKNYETLHGPIAPIQVHEQQTHLSEPWYDLLAALEHFSRITIDIPADTDISYHQTYGKGWANNAHQAYVFLLQWACNHYPLIFDTHQKNQETLHGYSLANTPLEQWPFIYHTHQKGQTIHQLIVPRGA